MMLTDDDDDSIDSANFHVTIPFAPRFALNHPTSAPSKFALYATVPGRLTEDCQNVPG